VRGSIAVTKPKRIAKSIAVTQPEPFPFALAIEKSKPESIPRSL